MQQAQEVQIHFTGGIVSPGYLKEILSLADLATVRDIRFGLRQQLIMDVPQKYYQTFIARCGEMQVDVFTKKAYQLNIVSSYPAAGIFTTDSWVREGVYKDIFDQFDYQPQLKINICDSSQKLVPLFTGHINWVSSSIPHFWYLYIRQPGKQPVACWKDLVYTNDLANLSRLVEQWIFEGRMSDPDLFEKAKTASHYTSKPIESALDFPEFALPYYEGFNKENNSWWLGIYRRDETYPVAFLQELCDICLQSKIGQVYTTPWKSLVIKGIESGHRILWDRLLGRYRINVRHAANELNWQVEDGDEEGLIIKRFVIRHFDKEDVRTHGLCFAVHTRPGSSLFGSVIISKRVSNKTNRSKSLDRFDIYYKEGFNPNASRLVRFRENLEKEHLPTYLVSLCKIFYEQVPENLEHTVSVEPNIENAEMSGTKMIYQCTKCFTVCDQAEGAVLTDIPDDYRCTICEAPKSKLLAVPENALMPC